LYDKVKDVQVIVSGSSSDELALKTEDPLTGRKFEYVLLPMSFNELASASSPIDEMRQLERRLMFGSYPDVVVHAGDEVDRIREIGKGYLYKDILKYDDIKRPELIDKLLRALAFQIGQEVSFAELSQLVGSDPKTVSKYIDILEKAFIVFKLGSYSRNLRNELKKSRKVYFYDLGIRNYVLETGVHLIFAAEMRSGICGKIILFPSVASTSWQTRLKQECFSGVLSSVRK
jgi:predicted AAA+ superfamily ATPase